MKTISPRRATREDPVPCVLVNTDPHKKPNESFHRCYGCGEYPELAGPIAIKVSFDRSGFHCGFCARCVDHMHNILHNK